VSKSLLVKIPSVPFHLDALRPDAYLAKLAAYLVNTQHDTQIWDFGTLEMLQRLYPVALHKSAIQRVDEDYVQQVQPNYVKLWDQWKIQKQSHVLDEHQKSVWIEIAELVIREKTLDFIVFKLDAASDRSICEIIIPMIRMARPNLLVVGTGTWLQKDNENLPDSLSFFDCIYRGGSGSDFLCWVDQLDNRESWNALPSLAFSDSVRMYITDSDIESQNSEIVQPNYSHAVYPALYDETKILYFDVEEVTKNCADSVGTIRPPEQVVDEIVSLSNQFNTLAFHLSGCSPKLNHAEAVAQELFLRHLNINYSRECHVTSTTAAAISAISASGCHSLNFQIDSGSQRLLDKYYLHSFGVTQIEQLVRACKFSNIFTIMNFSYPSVEDDYHTRAETFRLIQRSKPNGASIAIPPQEHRSNSDLKSRSISKKKLRTQSEIHHEHDLFCDDIEDHGISTQITPQLALMAKLSNYHGQEEDFLQAITYQLMVGDVIGMETATEKINSASQKASNTITLTPFTRLQSVVGN
jgi:hypothetical protein